MEGLWLKQVFANELEALLKAGNKLHVIDVREVDEVATGKIPGAVNIPLGLIQFKMQELDRSKEYYIVCHSGGRSSMATRFLDGYGYDVTNVVGGMLSWHGEVE